MQAPLTTQLTTWSVDTLRKLRTQVLKGRENAIDWALHSTYQYCIRKGKEMKARFTRSYTATPMTCMHGTLYAGVYALRPNTPLRPKSDPPAEV